MRRVSELLVVVVLLFAAFQMGSCGQDDVQRERDTAYKLANHYRWQRDSTAAAQRKTDTITKVVIRQDARLTAELDSLRRVTVYADSVFRDTSATLTETRIAGLALVARVVTSEAQVVVYRDSVRTLISAHALERLATNKTLIAADTTIAGWKRVADAERRKKFWRGILIGGVVVAVVIVGGAVAYVVVAL